jgi:hypothetical protein
VAREVDTSRGTTLTIPEMPDGRYFSVLLLDNDHYTPGTIYTPGAHKLPQGTKYLGLILRIHLIRPDDPADVALVNKLQDQCVVKAGSANPFPAPEFDKQSLSDFTFSERVGATAIADSPDAVRPRAREQLALGAAQLKLMAGGGVTSSYDPLDVTQYTVPELRAVVETAENWGTYVTVHAYTPRAVRQAIEAGVRCIDHGQLLDEPTVQLLAEKGVWWSLQPFLDDQPSVFPEGSPNRIKQLEVFGGTDTAYALAKKFKVKTAWGTDTLFNAANAAQQGAHLAKMVR